MQVLLKEVELPKGVIRHLKLKKTISCSPKPNAERKYTENVYCHKAEKPD